MHASIRAVLTGALIGSVAVVGAFGLLVLVGQIPKAPFAAQWQTLFGGDWRTGVLLGGLAFVAIGTLWGLPFAAVPHPTVPKAMAWAIVPTLWALAGWPAVQGTPLFADGDPAGVLIPIVMNIVVWGSLLGWYARRSLSTRSPMA